MQGIAYATDENGKENAFYALDPVSGELLGKVETERQMRKHMLGVENIFVHGYNWNPRGDEKAHTSQYRTWEKWVPEYEEAAGFSWESDPGLVDTWRNKHLFPYHYAWTRAGNDVADALVETIEACEIGVNIVCHSLGSRVVSWALRQCHPLDEPLTVIVLNGAESSREMLCCVDSCPDTDFYFVGSKNDRILRYLGGLMTPGALYEEVVGLHGLPEKRDNATEIWLDSDSKQAFLETKDWDLNGSGFAGTGGHRTSITDSANWPLYKRILAGESIGG